MAIPSRAEIRAQFARRPYTRRVAWVAAAAALVLVVLAAAWPFGAMLRARGVTRHHVVWLTLAFEVVFAIYKWGVGGWSRYVPPTQSGLEAASKGEPHVPAA